MQKPRYERKMKAEIVAVPDFAEQLGLTICFRAFQRQIDLLGPVRGLRIGLS